MTRPHRVLVTGASGFIGSHLAGYLTRAGYHVRGVDIRHSEFLKPDCAEFHILDLRDAANCRHAVEGIHEVYSLAANMGGIGFIDAVHAEVMHDNVLINANMLEAAFRAGVSRYFFASSACVYASYRQESPDAAPLAEEDAYPAAPDSEYGWEKLYSERLCAAYLRDHGLQTRVGRYHNIYGPHGTWTGGREKAPAAISRKIAAVNDGEEISIWGDGQQTRTFCYIDDCLEGTYRLMRSDHGAPLNIGSDELVSINQLVDLVCDIAGKRVRCAYERGRPQGVRGRSSDNRRIRDVLDWRPSISLREGLQRTYSWVEAQVHAARRRGDAAQGMVQGDRV
jgi:GDP-D-mannose 3', 5'-epimerase